MSKRFDWKHSTIVQKAVQIAKVCTVPKHSQKRQKLPCIDCKLWVEAGQLYRSTVNIEQLMHEQCLTTRLEEFRQMNFQSGADRQRWGYPKPESERKVADIRIVKDHESPQTSEQDLLKVEIGMLKAQVMELASQVSYFNGFHEGFREGVRMFKDRQLNTVSVEDFRVPTGQSTGLPKPVQEPMFTQV